MSKSPQSEISARPGWERILFQGIGGLLIVWAAIFIGRSSYRIMGQRFFVLFDDAMISMTYARNLADGFGLVWNPGEFIEGITNPLWTFVMAAVHFLPLPTAKASLVIQILGLVLLVANLVLIRRLARAVVPDAPVVAAVAVVFTALYYPLAFWSLMGMEVGLLALMTTLAVLWSLEVMSGDRHPAWVFILLGFTTLVRIDMAVPFVFVTAFLALVATGRRREILLIAAATFMLFIGGQTIARYIYYGDFLPNTYYLKMTGYPMIFRAARGLFVFARWFAPFHVVVLACAAWGALTVRSRAAAFIGVLAVSQMFYSVYVGGDAWEDMIGCNRFIAGVMPLVFILAAAGVDGLRSRIADVGKRPVLGRVWCLGAVFVGVMSMNGMNIGEMVFVKEGYPKEFNRELLERALLIRYIAEPQASVAVTCAGILPYFSGRYCIDLLGKMDRKIARERVRIPLDWESVTIFKPGHVKWDHPYSVGELKPDIIVHLIGGEREILMPMVMEHYYPLNIPSNPETGQEYGYCLRKDSGSLQWGRVNIGGQKQSN